MLKFLLSMTITKIEFKTLFECFSLLLHYYSLIIIMTAFIAPNSLTGISSNSIISGSVTKRGIIKIIHCPTYPASRFKCPIKMLNKTSLFSCRNKEEFIHWYNRTSYGHKQLTQKISKKRVLNKNVLIAGFYAFNEIAKLNEAVNNSPIYENAENIFLVENNCDYFKELVSQGKFPTNPNVYVIDIGVCAPPIPEHGIISKSNNLDYPLFGRNKNESKFVPTISIIDKINNEFYEEEIMIKE